MRKKQRRIRIVPAFFAGVFTALLVGCSHADSATLEIFVVDFLGNMAAALLL